MNKSSTDENNKIFEEIFEELFLDYYPKVKSFAKKLVKSEEDAEDIAQDIFLKLWKSPNIIGYETAIIDSYLYKMTKNQVIDLIRKRCRESNHSDQDISELNITELIETETSLSKIYCKEIELIVELTLDQMPEQRRKIYKMSRYSGNSNNQIAQQLNISVRTVEHHIYLALIELKKMLNFLFFILFL